MNTEKALQTREVIFLAVLIVLATALRMLRLGTGLWFDEILTVINSVRLPLQTIVTHFPGNNDHPLYSVLAHIAIVLFGESPWSVRLPSALFGVAAIPLLYLVGKTVTSRFEAAAATLILTVSYHHIWFSQNARGYTALLVCALLSTFALLRWLDTGRRSHLVVYAVVIALGAYTHLTMVLVCVSHAIALGIDWLVRGAKSWVSQSWSGLALTFIGAAALTVLLYAPMIADVHTFFTTQTAARNEVATPKWAITAALSGLQLGFGSLWGILAGGIVFCAGIWSYFKQRLAIALLFLLPLPVTVLLTVAMQRPIFPRFFFFAIGFGLLIAVRGSAAIGVWLAHRIPGRMEPHRAGMIMASLLTLAAVGLSIRSLPYGYRFPKQDYAQAIAFVEETQKDQNLVAVIRETTAIPIKEYFGKPWQRVDDASQLRTFRLNGDGAGVLVMYTFPSYIEASQPELWNTIQSDCSEIGKFEGTIAGGTIHVRRCS